MGKIGFPKNKEMHMNTPDWLSPAIKGAVVGAAALAVVGFTWGGWVTGGTAREMATDQARLELITALVPICLEKSEQDPNVVATLAEMKEANFSRRSQLLMNAGWATMPGSSGPNRGVATECMKKLAAEF